MSAVEEAQKLLEEIKTVEVIEPEKNQKMSEMGKLAKNPNPFKANKYKRDPREIKCWNYYLETIKKGSPDGAGSARKAGYSESSASNITQHPWFKKRLSNLKIKSLVDKSEKVLEEILDLPNEVEITLDGVPTGLKKIDSAIIGHKKDVAKYCTERLKSDKYAQKQKSEVDLNAKVIVAKINEIFK